MSWGSTVTPGRTNGISVGSVGFGLHVAVYWRMRDVKVHSTVAYFSLVSCWAVFICCIVNVCSVTWRSSSLSLNWSHLVFFSVCFRSNWFYSRESRDRITEFSMCHILWTFLPHDALHVSATYAVAILSVCQHSCELCKQTRAVAIARKPRDAACFCLRPMTLRLLLTFTV